MSMKVELSDNTVADSGWQRLVHSVVLFRKQRGLIFRTVLPVTAAVVLIIAWAALLMTEEFGAIIFSAICLGIPAFGVVFVCAAYLWRNYFDRMMDLPTVMITDTTLKRGQPFELDYSQHFKQDTEIISMSVKVIMREWVRYTQGTDTQTDTRDIVIQEDWLENVPISADSDFTHTFNFTLPDNAMHTFDATNNKITWLVEVDIDLPGWLDFRNYYDISVSSQIDEEKPTNSEIE